MKYAAQIESTGLIATGISMVDTRLARLMNKKKNLDFQYTRSAVLIEKIFTTQLVLLNHRD